MKIYPSQLYHCPEYITARNIDKDLSIPLAYLNNDNPTYRFDRICNDDFQVTKKELILPKQELPSENILIFDEYGNPADSSKLINRSGGKYYYDPNNMVTFTPLLFSYNVTVKRKISYRNSKEFNFNISCVDDENKLDFLKQLEQILLNVNSNDMLKNVNIKNKKIQLNAVDEKTDFVFVQSPDGEHYNFFTRDPYLDPDNDEYATTSKIALNSFLRQNINTWIISDDNMIFPAANSTGINIGLAEPKTKKMGYFNIRDYYNSKDPALSNYKVHNIFENNICPVLIIEHPNQGFVIYSTSEIFNNAEKYRDLIFEILVYVYSNSYIKSRTAREYITYEIPDYEIINNTLVPKNNFISSQTLDQILETNLKEFVITDLQILDVKSDLPKPDEDIGTLVEFINFNGISNNRIQFKMTGKSCYVEPVKPTGWKSVYYNNKIYYLEDIHYLFETRIGEANDEPYNRLYTIEKDSNLEIILYPFKSSKHGLNITRDLRLVIPSIKTEVNGFIRTKNEAYTLCINKNTKDLCYFFEDDYKEKLNSKDEEVKESIKDMILLTTIIIQQEEGKDYLTDMRVRGGGLPEDMPDNFNLLDIGHIYGRPYRQANTLVFTLPKKYEIYKDEIFKAIEKYKVAEDYVAIFFEDQETDGE